MGSCISTINTQNPTSAKIEKMDSINSSSSIPPTPTKDTKPPPVDSPRLSSSLPHKSKVSPFINSVSSYRSHGSREDTFYDTQGWLESDCEEDFYSVNGDFTPSRSNTPVHHAIGTSRLNRVFSPKVNRALFEGRPSLTGSFGSQGTSSVHRRSISSNQFPGNFTEVAVGTNSESSSKSRRKSLVDLFRESMRERDGVGLAFAGYENETNQMGTSPIINGLPPMPPKGHSPLSRMKTLPSNDNRTPAVDYAYEKEKSLKMGHRCFPRLVSLRSFNESKKASSPALSVNGSKSQKSNKSSEMQV